MLACQASSIRTITVGAGLKPDSAALRLAGSCAKRAITAGGDLRPAPKLINFWYRTHVAPIPHVIITLVFSHVNEQPMKMLQKAGFDKEVGVENFCPNIDTALLRAKEIVSANK